ncbi:MAG: 6-bladed beta-propeller [Betaproteobacteria bacterium]|nr:6-bladed beta-propeller [Betaproteobacteria bacterium]
MWNAERRFRGLLLAGFALFAASCAEVPQKKEDARKEDKPLVFPAPPDEARFIFERSIYSSADILEADKNAALRRALTGEAERGGEGVGKPYGVAVRRGKIFVADSVGSAVKVFDVPRKKFSVVGTDDPGIAMPLGLDTDAEGKLYVVDATAKSVKVFDANGKFLRAFGGQAMFSRPTGVAVNPEGTRAWVVDTGGVDKQVEHRVRVFNAKTGEHLFDFGKRGTGPGEFNLARDIVLAPNGLLYVVDGANFRIQVFQQDGKFERAFGSVGRSPGQFARPREIAADKQSNIYVTDAAFGNLQIFNEKGEVLMFIGTRSEADQPAKYLLPAGIAVDEDGRIYVADQFFRRIDIFRPYNRPPTRPGNSPAPPPSVRRPPLRPCTRGAAIPLPRSRRLELSLPRFPRKLPGVCRRFPFRRRRSPHRLCHQPRLNTRHCVKGWGPIWPENQTPAHWAPSRFREFTFAGSNN